MDRSFHEHVLPAAILAGHLGEEQAIAAFVDIDGVRQTVEALRDAFPPHFEHAFAAKANTMQRALALVREAGMGCEVASPGELEQALRAGFGPSQIVYDEPAKTGAVLRRVLESGISLNIDNFQEFKRVQRIMEEDGSASRIGFRINPQVGTGTITAMSTATNSSKFGVALEDEGNREALVDAYRAHPWLTTLHSHVGSQGCSLDLLTEGVRKLTDLANGINASCGRRQVELLDIGGGLPVNFNGEEVRPTFSDYAAKLQARVPELFTGEYRVKTEFGRSIYAKNGFIAARVEYTKVSGGRRVALTHAGAQVATRTIFMPAEWPLRVTVTDGSGRPRAGETSAHDIGGPLCFAGDLVARDRPLPTVQPGDWVVLHDTGAYYFSNPFYYNALPACAVYGVEDAGRPTMRFAVWREQQSADDMLSVIG
jgi:diaminopimelate decarboxylase